MYIAGYKCCHGGRPFKRDLASLSQDRELSISMMDLWLAYAKAGEVSSTSASGASITARLPSFCYPTAGYPRSSSSQPPCPAFFIY